MKEYIVALHKGVDYNQFWNEIESSTDGISHIPDRPVTIANNLDALNRVTHYFLTDAEAETLRYDPRVLGVEIPAEHRDDIEISTNSVQESNFTKTTLSTGDYVNWGLIRNSNQTNVYGSGNTTTENYNYPLDGSNVDIVIVDTGIQANHPEFQYSGNSTSRVQQYQWYAGLNPTNYYTDVDGHGTHVAGIAAGKTYGWAKNANIYALKYNGVNTNQIANYIKTWHNSKSVNPVTGVKNPTVVNMSYAYYVPGSLSTTLSIANVTYRGNIINNPGYGPSSPYGLIFTYDRVPYWNETYNVPIDELTDAGIVVCISAGNDGQKVDIPGGLDWDNSVGLTYTANGRPAGSCYYMRGESPTSTTSTTRGDAIITGALNATTYNASLDKKASYSMAGPGVDIFSAGSNIMSACSTINVYNGQQYQTTTFKQVNLFGTSQASPQTAGIAALFLQANPTATPSQVRSALISSATPTMIGNISTNPSGTDYGNTVSQWGGNAGVAYMQFSSATTYSVSGAATLNNVTITNK